MNAFVDAGIQTEGRLLYTLLDAADDAGRIPPEMVARWRATKTRVVRGAPYESEARALHDLLMELEAKGTLAHTWIEERWLALETRVGAN